MKKFLPLFLFIVIGVYAQEESRSKQKKENLITFDILSPSYVDFNGEYNTPRWRLGYIHQITNKSKVGFDIGFGNANLSLIPTGNDYSLWEIRPAYYYIFNPKRKSPKYFAIEAFYIKHKEVFITQSFINQHNDSYYFDRADYQRTKIGLIAQLGMFIHLSNRIGLNLYSGIGFKHRLNEFDNFENLRLLENPKEEHFTPYYREEEGKFGVEFTIGLKFYYRVRN